MELLVGADPELFLKHRETGLFHSAHGLIPGSKQTPYPVDNGAVQVDGMALEFNIAPALDEEAFVHNIHSVMGTLRDMIPDEYETEIQATAIFSEEHMKEQPEEALLLGCGPDYNAYEQELNPPKEADPQIRVAGGHIHLGWTKDQDPMEQSHFMGCCELARQMDYYLGVPSVLLDPDMMRSWSYGAPGSFRPTTYGVEYRTLSNFWIETEELTKWAFRQTKKAFDALVAKEDMYTQFGGGARDMIRRKDTVEAKGFIIHRPEMYDMGIFEKFFKYTKPNKKEGKAKTYTYADLGLRAGAVNMAPANMGERQIGMQAGIPQQQWVPARGVLIGHVGDAPEEPDDEELEAADPMDIEFDEDEDFHEGEGG